MRILILDDDLKWIERLSEVIAVLGYEPCSVTRWKEALSILRSQHVQAFILDLHLGWSFEDGLLLLSLMREEGLLVPTVVVSYSADLVGVAGLCYSYPFVKEVIPKSRFVEFSFPFQRFFSTIDGTKEIRNMTVYSRIFVVHGHNISVRDRVVGILNSLRVIPVYLEREATAGRTIIELVEQCSDVQYGVAIMTADDIGCLAINPDQMTPRARQNVILEIGFLMGRLGRDRMMILKEDVEMPSDLAGMRYLDLLVPNDTIKTAFMRDFQKLGNIAFQP
jgi:hypothetical protein